jgi:polyisoprenoid-binding protein YceI
VQNARDEAAAQSRGRYSPTRYRKREVCGAHAVDPFTRADFGVNAGLQFGFRQDVLLRIQVEAIRLD